MQLKPARETATVRSTISVLGFLILCTIFFYFQARDYGWGMYLFLLPVPIIAWEYILAAKRILKEQADE